MNASRTAWFQWRLALNTPGIAFRHPLETQIDVSRPSNQPLEMQIAPDRRPRITLTMWDHPQSLRDSPSGPAVKDARPAGATLSARRPARLRLRTAPPAVRPTGGGHRQNTMSTQKALRRGPFAHCGYSGITRSRGIPPNRRRSHPRPERRHRTARSAYQPHQHHRPPVRSRRRPRPRPARVRP